MAELLEEHVQARKKLQELRDLNEKYKTGEENSKEELVSKLKEIDTFYLKHIDTEDHHFFLEVTEYFNDTECSNMFAEFKSFDKDLMTEKYTSLVETLEQAIS